MHSGDHLAPPRAGPESSHYPAESAHHRRPRYYVHRVRESLHTRVTKLLCAIFLGLVFFTLLILFIMWIGLRPHRPRIHIRDFSISNLGHSDGYQNAQIVINFTALNPNHKIGVYYDAMSITIDHKSQTIGAAHLLVPFYEDYHNTTVLYGVLSGPMLTLNKQRWAEIEADRAAGTVLFGIKITSSIRMKLFVWDTKHKRMHNQCHVGVGPDGAILASYRDKRCPISYFS